jgi:Fic family protein
VLALSEADAALGLLNSLGRLINQPEILLGPFLTREALSSSRIEGTKASLTDVLRAEATSDEGERQSDDVDEVARYLTASRLGLARIGTLPITQCLIKELHATFDARRPRGGQAAGRASSDAGLGGSADRNHRHRPIRPAAARAPTGPAVRLGAVRQRPAPVADAGQVRARALPSDSP